MECMSKLDEITLLFVCPHIDLYGQAVKTEVVRHLTEEEKQQIKALFLELIGENENEVEALRISQTWAEMRVHRNNLRAELRKKVEEL